MQAHRARQGGSDVHRHIELATISTLDVAIAEQVRADFSVLLFVGLNALGLLHLALLVRRALLLGGLALALVATGVATGALGLVLALGLVAAHVLTGALGLVLALGLVAAHVLTGALALVATSALGLILALAGFATHAAGLVLIFASLALRRLAGTVLRCLVATPLLRLVHAARG